MRTLNSLACLATVATMLLPFTTAQAEIVGASSNTSNIVIDGAQGSPHHPGGNYPGIRVAAAGAPYGSFTIAFDALQNLAGVDSVVNGYKVSTLNVSDMPASHSQLGNFDFVQVPNSDVYFGEWKANRNTGVRKHTVYYGGQHKTTNMPRSGRAIYNVKGINHYTGNNLLTGSLRADFRRNRLFGGIGTNVGDSKRLDVRATINPSNASFNGYSRFNGHRGTTKGHFFGNNAQSLAGIAEFNNIDYNTSFGGNKR